MLLKIITLFLLGMAAIAMIGRFRTPRLPRRRAEVPPPTLCGHCGRFIVGKEPCPCRKGKV
ncbi:hypothetical protein [Cereibacter johrii]|uniref:Short-chain dehydrogenase n=1 Tax=Cereibacter johrii TaxID=445629 RepID=A0ABX5J9H6_9RHOB|nr:hypothetical protein [Cereibacter johrii]QCP86837.1 hypothetical protein EYE35_14435 [Cereibacter sphaeroides]RDS93754.1 hypothetical protein DWF04_21615 [Cereibacter sphaeroides f. sp. denitrificans]MEA5159476.1 hypothetical protein [Cereibacter johrii]ODM41677.1 hypothetical protein A9O63_02420 [Cereibacter johrii]PTM79553.1 hypothetical protein C8J29_103658 [Cereibacter johrii]